MGSDRFAWSGMMHRRLQSVAGSTLRVASLRLIIGTMLALAGVAACSAGCGATSSGPMEAVAAAGDPFDAVAQHMQDGIRDALPGAQGRLYVDIHCEQFADTDAGGLHAAVARMAAQLSWAETSSQDEADASLTVGAILRELDGGRGELEVDWTLRVRTSNEVKRPAAAVIAPLDAAIVTKLRAEKHNELFDFSRPPTVAAAEGSTSRIKGSVAVLRLDASHVYDTVET